MSDQEDLVIKVRLDTSAAMSSQAAVGRTFDRVTAKANASYKAVGKAADTSATQRTTAAGRAADADVRSLDRARDALGRFASQGKADMGSVAGASGGLLSKLQQIGGAAFGLHAITGAIRDMGGAMHAAVLESQKQVDQLLSLKNMIRDIASMTGSQGGSSDAFAQKFLDIRKASGLDASGAKGFLQGFAGSGEAKKGINISAEEYEKAKPLIARYAAANSAGDAGAAESYGNLSGLLLGYRAKGTAGTALSDLTDVNDILKLGVGDNPTLIREYSQQAGALLGPDGSGLLKDPRELAALISTASIQRSAGQAGTVVQQASKILRGFGGSQGGMLKGAGITPEDKMIPSLNKLFAKIQEAEAKGIAPDQFLAAGGVDADEDRRSLVALYAGRNYTDRFLSQAATPSTEDAAKAQLDSTFRADAGLQANVAQAQLDEAKAQNAMLFQHMKPLELQAETNLVTRGEGADSPYAAAQDKLRGNLSTVGGLMLPSGMTAEQLGHQFRVEEEMNKLLADKGIQIPNRPNPTSPLGGYSGDYTTYIASGAYREAYAQATSTQYLGQQVAGGRSPDPNAPGRTGNDAAWGAVVKAIQDQTKIIQATNQQKAQPMPPARMGGRGRP